MKKLIVFDLDGTLAESKAALDSEMAGRDPTETRLMIQAVIACLGA
jgi:hydroxymethylpyrimidine pyrophosphatase-like HAD family hydrolase